MKKNLFSAMAVAALAMLATSCSSELDNVTANNSKEGLVPMTFTATQETGVTSRTVLGNNGNINWKAGDQVMICTSSSVEGKDCYFPFTAQTGGSSSTTLVGSFDAGYTNFTAYYLGSNYQSKVTTDLPISLPTEQTATANSFDPKANLMFAPTTASTSLEFKNVCSYLRLETTKEYKKIVLTTDVAIAGQGEVIYVDPSYVFNPKTNTSKSVTLVPASGSTTIAAGTYYIAIAPVTAKKITTDCYNTDGTTCDELALTNATGYSLARGQVNNLGKTSDTGWKNVPTYVTITSANGNTMKWATMNVGATTVADAPETAFGDYYAWGATTTWYNNKSGITYTWNSSSSKYDVTFASSNFWKSGYTDGYTSSHVPTVAGSTLSATEDIATKTYGSNWRMPTSAEFKWLADACNTGSGSYTFTNVASTSPIPTAKGIYWIAKRDATYKVPGMLFIDENGASVFFPAAGLIGGTSLEYAGTTCLYWSSSLFSTSTNAYRVNFNSSRVLPQDNFSRNGGLTVRPVSE